MTTSNAALGCGVGYDSIPPVLPILEQIAFPTQLHWHAAPCSVTHSVLNKLLYLYNRYQLLDLKDKLTYIMYFGGVTSVTLLTIDVACGTAGYEHVCYFLTTLVLNWILAAAVQVLDH
jgi:hypothetical protein